jgi:hypothetical protein
MTILTSPLRTISERQGSLDHDIEAVARCFGAAQPLLNGEIENFGATTFADTTFRRVDPLREPIQVADDRLQSRLETLCETLRAKY